MRILSITTTRPASGVLADGSPAPPLPLLQVIPLARLAGISLMAQVDPPATGGKPPTVIAQVVLAQMDNGNTVPIARNLAPGDVAKQAQLRANYDAVITQVRDDTIAVVQVTYLEIS